MDEAEVLTDKDYNDGSQPLLELSDISETVQITPNEENEDITQNSVSDADFEDDYNEDMLLEETNSGEPNVDEHTYTSDSDVRVGRIRDWAWQHYIQNDRETRSFKATCRHCSTLVSSRHDRLRAHLENQHPELMDMKDTELIQYYENSDVEEPDEEIEIKPVVTEVTDSFSQTGQKSQKGVWAHFTTPVSGRARRTTQVSCNYCFTRVSTRRSRALGHLQTHHPHIMEDLRQEKLDTVISKEPQKHGDPTDLKSNIKTGKRKRKSGFSEIWSSFKLVKVNGRNQAHCRQCSFLLKYPKASRLREHMNIVHLNIPSNEPKNPRRHNFQRPLGFTNCLFCQGEITNSKSYATFQAWNASCAKSMCEVLNLDKSFQIYFTPEKFCDSCVQNVRNIDFTLKALSNLNSTLEQTRKLLTGLLEVNYERVTGLSHVVPASRLTKNVISYNNAVKTVFEAFNHPGTQETFRPSQPEISEPISIHGLNEDVCPVDISNPTSNIDFEEPDQLIKSEIEDNEDDSTELLHQSCDNNGVKNRRVSATRTRADRMGASKSHGQDLEPYRCTRCPMRFKDSLSFEHHYKRHSRNPRFSCKTCHKSFFKKLSLKTHIATYPSCVEGIGDVTPATKCVFCALLCTAEEMEKHRDRHETKRAENVPFGCVLCDQQFTNTLDLRNHVGLEHETGLPRCDQCAKVFTNRIYLRRHIEDFHSDPNPALGCTECPYIASSKSCLARHIRTHHCFTKDYQCEHCGNTYKSNSNLRTHMKLHSNETPFRCRICPKAFNQSCKLKAHEQIHAPEKTLICDKCGKIFRTTKNLWQHRTYYCKDGPKLPYPRSSERKNRPLKAKPVFSREKDLQVSETYNNSVVEHTALRPGAGTSLETGTNASLYPVSTETRDIDGSSNSFAAVSISSMSAPLHSVLQNFVDSDNIVIIQPTKSTNGQNEFQTLNMSQSASFTSSSQQRLESSQEDVDVPNDNDTLSSSIGSSVLYFTTMR